MTAGILSRLPLLAKWSGRMIQIKTPHEIELMRGLRAGDRRRDRRGARPPSARASAPVSSTPSPRTTSARQGAVPELPGLPRVHRHHLRLDQQRDRARHPEPATGRWPRATTSPSTAGRSCKGWHSDSAVTVTVGEPSAEDAALHGRDGAVDVGRAWPGRSPAAGSPTSAPPSSETITAETHPYGIVDHYGGHGIGTEMHQDPHVLNYGRPGRGPKLVPGLALAIEPMVTVGRPGHRRARGRLDRRHQGRLARRALRAHRRHHARGPVGAHRRGRRRRRPGPVRDHAPHLSSAGRGGVAHPSRGPGW